MESDLIKLASSQGVWATLSVVLIFYVLKTQEKRDIKQGEREQNYLTIITTLTEKLTIVSDIKEDVKEIKDTLKK